MYRLRMKKAHRIIIYTLLSYHTGVCSVIVISFVSLFKLMYQPSSVYNMSLFFVINFIVVNFEFNIL